MDPFFLQLSEWKAREQNGPYSKNQRKKVRRYRISMKKFIYVHSVTAKNTNE